MDDLGVEQREEGGLFLAIFFGIVGVLALGASLSSLEIYRSIRAIQFDGIRVFHLLGTFPVEIARENQAELAGGFYELTVVSSVVSLVLIGLAIQQLFQWWGTRKAELARTQFFN